MIAFVPLETVIRRAPLGLRFLDLARGVTVSDGLVVEARQLGGLTVNPSIAVSSPMSGIYGFRTLPGLHRYEVGDLPAGFWCGSPFDPGEPSPDELADLATLRSIFDENAPPAANFVISVRDRLARFLPQTLLMCLPKEHLVEVPLFSSPARLGPAGFGVVRGEIAEHPTGTPAAWALVTATLDGVSLYTGITDARGMFVLFVPYTGALPELTGSPPHGAVNLGQLSWPVTIQTYYQPSVQRTVPGFTTPDTRSILAQAAAGMHDTAISGPLPALTRSIAFGEDLVVTTTGGSRLLVDPA